MDERIVRIVAQVFGLAEDAVKVSDGPETVPTWDSLAHLNLMLALEAEFGVELAPDDAMRMTSVGAIHDVLAGYGAVRRADP
jgi:acyl carrier protein